MIDRILTTVNWVDVVVCLTIIWIVFTGIKNGLVKELFHLLGTIFSVFISFHYYSAISGLFIKKTPISESAVDVIVFLLLWFFSFLAFRFFEKGVFFIFTIEVQSMVDKWGSAVFAIVRAALITSMCMFLLLLTQSTYLQNQALSSFSRKGLLFFAPKLYLNVFEDLIHPLFPNENRNNHVSSVMKGASSSRQTLLKGDRHKDSSRKQPGKTDR